MITTDSTARSSRYRIMESAISFTENYQDTNLHGNPIYDVVYVSLVSNASIMVYDANNGIDYGADLQYKRWRLNGATTGLVSPDAHNIYAKLSKTDSNPIGDIVFSTYNYTTQGVSEEKDAEGNPIKDYSGTHWMIKIGTLSALTSPSSEHPDRTLTFDPGKLGTQQDNNEKGGGWVAEMFDVVVADPNRIKPRLWFDELKVLGKSIFDSIADFYKGFRIGNGENAKEITSVATDKSVSEDSDNAIATPAYVKAFSEGRYLRRDTQDPQSVSGPVTFEQDVTVKGNQSVSGNQSISGKQEVTGTTTLHDDLTIGDFIEQGDLIQGAQVTKDGIASFAKVKTPSMQVYELTLNRKTAVQGEFVFSDGEVVENVEFLGADTYLLTVRALYEGYITTFKKDDILYSNINIIGESAKTGKCWMYVTAVNGNEITAVHYPYEACPAGENINPVPYMTITRHGNISDKTRQDLFIISSEASSLTMLRGVSAPIVSSEGLYGVVIGKLPATLLEYIHTAGIGYVNGEDPYVYARGVIVQDLIMLDYQGQPIPTEAYRGEWQAKTKYYNKGNVYDSVTHQGSLWQCIAAETTEEPSDNSEDWIKKVSKGEDGDMPTIFTITSSLTSIHQDSSGKLNTNILDIWVNAVGAPSNFEIKDQATLDAYGLSVWFNIDEQEDVRTRLKLIIGGADSIEVEEGGAIIVAEEDDDDGGAYITLESESIDISSVQSKINIYLVRDADEDGFGVDENRMYIPVMRDGQRGRMLYPAGVYDNTKEYMIENNSAPFVKYQVLEGKPTYYVLIWEGGAVKGIEPNSEGSDKYWRPFTYMNYLFAEFFMANWAKFGGDNGAVFYDRWLFSQKGREDNETTDSYYSDVTEPIFNSLSDFVGWSPNLALDFKNGKILAKDADITGHINATSGDIDNVKATNITVNSGVIGGFQISDSSIGTTSSINEKAKLYLSNDLITASGNGGNVRLGPSAMPSSIGVSALGYFKNIKESEVATNSILPAYGLIIETTTNRYNYAIKAEGAITANKGFIKNPSFSHYKLTGGQTFEPYWNSLYDFHNPFKWLIRAKDGTVYFILPTYKTVQGWLNIDSSENFIVDITVVRDYDSDNNSKITIYGRNNDYSDAWGGRYNTTDYPAIRKNNESGAGQFVDVTAMRRLITFTLVYNKDGVEDKYYAYTDTINV